MPLLVMNSGAVGVPVTLHMTSEPVTFPGLGVPVEVPEGYVAVLTDPKLTGSHSIALVPEAPAVEGESDEEGADPAETTTPRKGRKPKEA